MARASMKDLVGKTTPVAAPETAGPAETPAAPQPTVKASAGADARINFVISAELRQKFKVWAAANGTTIKDELTRYIEELVN